MIESKNPVVEKAVVKLKKLSDEENAKWRALSLEMKRLDDLTRINAERRKWEAEKLCIAKKFLEKGVSEDVVIESTGLSYEQIHDLK